MNVDTILTEAKHLISEGEIDQAVDALSAALRAYAETPFHHILHDTFRPDLATETKQYYARQQKRQNVEMVMFLLGDITAHKRWVQWKCVFDTYSSPYRKCVLKPPAAVSTVVLLHQLSKVDRGFATRYRRREFPEEAEIARLLVHAKLIQTFAHVAAKKFSNVDGSVVVSSENAEVYAEFIQGQWVPQPDPTEYGSFDSGEGLDSINNRVRARVGDKTKARFAAYSVFPGRVLVDNLDDIAIKGRAIVVADAAPSWGGPDSTAFESNLLENPTWLDLCAVLDQQINATLDFQHVFLEGVEKCGTAKINGITAQKYSMVLGS